jgi:ABC-type multidrug transport system fused ATPase/permease subunit
MIQLIRGLVRPYRRILVLVFLAMLVETAASIAGPWPLKIILDNVVGTHHFPEGLARLVGTILDKANKMQIAAMAGVSVMAIAVIGAVASYMDNYWTESVAQRVAQDLRMRTYHHLQRLSLGYYDRQQVGVFLSTLTTDIGTVQTFASSGTLGIVVDLFTVVGMLGLMFWLNWDFALIAASVTPFLLLFVSRFKRAVKKATKEVRTNQAEIVAVELQGLQAQRVVKAFGRQDFEEERLGRASRATVESALKARKIKSLLAPIVTVTVAGCTAVVLWRGAALILAGTMTIGALTVFLAYLNRFFKPVQDLAKMTNSIAQTAVSVERLQAILAAGEIISDRLNAREPESLRGDISFEQVTFGYFPETPVLRDVSFSIKAGQLVGIVGPTGSGKSTVVSLIPRFYDATGGRITIDDTDIRDYKVQGLRSKIGFVLQDTVLFQGTIRENIAYGRPGATFDEIVEAARLANADEFIDRMPLGYNAIVGERGATLSGGQRQRIGIARAIVRNSPILILDEPTAALDLESEERVIEALERLMKGRTVVMIAHRLSTLRDADKIIVLQNGMVVEQGDQAHLLTLGGVYAQLHQAQSEEEGTKTGVAETSV